MKKLNNGGFTLIEMIVVLAIIAILSSLAIPQISKYIDKANETKIMTVVSELNNIALLMQLENSQKEYTILEIIKEASETTKVLNMEEGNANFIIGKYKGRFELENDKVIARIYEPSNMIYRLGSKFSDS